MLDRDVEALAVYQGLIDRGIDDIANGACGEGRAWARGLVADAHYRESICYAELKDRKRALASIRKHLKFRGPGCRSIYPISKARSMAEDLGRRL
ncbi:MAG: hypothetical protein NVSMB31_02000 [Vulcanimicrobiaceae bacterium]